MPREYRNIQQYENEILELNQQGLTHRAIGEKFELSQKQVKKFFERYRQRQRKIETGKVLHKAYLHQFND